MKFENTTVTNFENAILGARNPMESHKRMDSFYDKDGKYILGENDLGLMQRLLKASMAQGNSHSKFMRQILVSVNITAPLFWWKEADQYRVGVTTNSESTMHRLAKTPITLENFEIGDYQPGIGVCVIDEKGNEKNIFAEDHMNDTIEWCEALRLRFLETKDQKYWKELIRSLPESWLQKRMTTLNYQVLRQMYFDRRHHKLTEWSKSFVEWIKTLPYAKELIMYEGDDKNA